MTVIPKGVWSSVCELRFCSLGENSHSSGSSFVFGEGGETVPVTSLDEALAGQRVTFIKMDIEGSELEALKGAEKTIREQKPKLAICVYHKPEDIWEIPELMLEFNEDYRFYMRHYSLASFDTVLYAI